ncbi:hypothetical protein GH733_017367 [Mirounga leonina]|nr:hypothetical protein GH733_017367 [Mirounga leonina]
MGDQQHCDEAKAVDILHIDTEALKKLNKNLKNYSRSWPRNMMHFCLQNLGSSRSQKPWAEACIRLTKQVAKVNEVKSTSKLQTKKVLCLAVATGHMKMTDDELVHNIHLTINFLVSRLKKNWQNI